jgi:ankyrin repeat protein
MFAASYGLADVAAELLDHKADPNAIATDETGWTALFAAACGGHSTVARLLLSRGADAAIKDRKGKTALACAEERGHSEVARALRGTTKR